MAEELIKLGGYVVQGHGSDETVLWEGNVSKNVAINLPEPAKNFDKIICVCETNDTNSFITIEMYTSFLDNAESTRWSQAIAQSRYMKILALVLTNNTLTLANCYEKDLNGTAAIVEQFFKIRKVVGVGRKAGV